MKISYYFQKCTNEQSYSVHTFSIVPDYVYDLLFIINYDEGNTRKRWMIRKDGKPISHIPNLNNLPEDEYFQKMLTWDEPINFIVVQKLQNLIQEEYYNQSVSGTRLIESDDL